jgi:hypothetical protein
LGADLVWSDNLHQVLEMRTDAVLSGSFFWHEVIEDAFRGDNRARAFAERSREMIHRHVPVMIGHELFATPDVRRLADFRGVGFYLYGRRTPKFNGNNKGVLLSCGLSDRSADEVRAGVEYLVRRRLPKGITVWVEPRFCPKHTPEWMKPALFDDCMFANLAAACSRPGMGTISDVLLSGARLFAFHGGSFEMRHNSVILEQTGLGRETTGAVEALKMAMKYLENPEAIREQTLKAAALKADGVEKTAEVIVGRLGGKI